MHIVPCRAPLQQGKWDSTLEYVCDQWQLGAFSCRRKQLPWQGGGAHQEHLPRNFQFNFSDGAPTQVCVQHNENIIDWNIYILQYKNKYWFANILSFFEDYNVDASWSYFATSHGKVSSNECLETAAVTKTLFREAGMELEASPSEDVDWRVSDMAPTIPSGRPRGCLSGAPPTLRTSHSSTLTRRPSMPREQCWSQGLTSARPSKDAGSSTPSLQMADWWESRGSRLTPTFWMWTAWESKPILVVKE